MLKNLQCVCLDPAPFRPQPIRRSMEERAIRFELERQACQSLRKVLQLKLQQRRTREELATQGMMPALKSSAAFHKQTGSLERAWTDEDLKRKIKSKPDQSGLDRRQIFEETSAEPAFPAMQLKRARLTDDQKATRRPRSMELIHKNSIPVQPRPKQASMDFPKTSRESSSCDEHSNDSLSPGQAVSQECPLGSGLVHSPTEDLSRSSVPSPTQMPPSGLHFPPICGSFNSVKMASRALDSSTLMGGSNTHIKPKLNSDRFCQKNKKAKDNKPKIKKLKYHQYIPPDRKGDKESPPHLDSSYAKILQQQQLYLQLQILSQQQNHNYHTILPAPPKDQKQSSSSSTTSSSSPQSSAPPSADLPHQQSHICLSSSAEIKAVSANPNLDDMKVTELRSELKLRSLPISGTKNNLIERLRSYQEQNQGCDFTSSPTAEGTKGLELEDAPESSKAAATAGDCSPQGLQFQQLETSSFRGNGVSPASSPEQLMRRGDNIKPLPPPSKSPKYISLSSDPLGQRSCSPTEFNLQSSSVAQRPANIKKEPPCSTRTPCQFSLKSVPLQKHRLPSSPATSAAAPLVAADKDRMLLEKDKQIAELTRMLRQKQKLVEVLRMQLEHESRGASEPQVFLKVKEEPPGNSCASPQISPELDPTRITIKQEAVEVDIGGASVGPPRRAPPLQPATEKIKDWVRLSLRPDQRIPQEKPPALQFGAAQQQKAIQRCIHGTQQKQKNPQKLQMIQREQQKQQHSEHLQPRPAKQQDKPKQQRQFKEKQTKQLQEIQTHGKQQKCPKNLKLQNDSTPNGKLFLIPPNGHINTDQSRNSGSRASKNIPLQAQKGAAPAHVHQPEQEECLGAPSSLQPFFIDQDPASRRRDPATPAFQIDLCSDLDVLLSPVSPASVKTASSLLDDNDQENEGDFIDILLLAGEMSSRLAPDPSLDSLHPAPFSSLSPAPPPHLLISPPIRPSPDPSKPAASLQPELQEERQHLSTSGRLEDFLESTTGKPLLGVEPGGVITLIDDLHSQLLCTPSILDHPPSPMETLDSVEGWGFDNKDWLDFSTGGERDEDTPTLAPLGPPTPVSVFSTDFLDSSDLHLHWDSCL